MTDAINDECVTMLYEAMPAHRPSYPPPPVYFQDVETQLVEFETDPAVLQAHLPKPLIADPMGRVVAVSLKVGQSSVGPFLEAGLYLRCLYDGRPAVFNSHLYLDNVAAICAGREMWGYPKEYARIAFNHDEGVLTCEVAREGTVILRIATTCNRPVDAAELPSMAPHYNLKLIPRAEGPGPAIMQLLRSNAETIGESRQYGGYGQVEFRSSAKTELGAFSPRRILGGYFHIGSVKESHATVVIDYLKGKTGGENA